MTFPQWPILPSHPALLQRQTDVNVILATAPPDQRKTIDGLRAGQLSLHDTQQLLTEALGTQGGRQAWILENWPHVVEAAEINTALTRGVFGPNMDRLGDSVLANTDSALLARAARASEPWFAAAVDALAEPDDSILSERSVGWLEAVAEYRLDYRIQARDPLGYTPIDSEQLRRFEYLHAALDQMDASPFVEPLTLDSYQPGTPGFEKHNQRLLDALSTPGDVAETLGREMSRPDLDR